MKRTFIAIAMFMLSLGMMAVPAKRGQWKTIKLADGTEVKAELRGDERVNYWQTEDGRRFVRNTATDRYEVADLDALKQKALERQATVKLDNGRKNAPAASSATRAGSDYTGEKKGLVIMVEFPDMPFTHGTPELYQRILNEEDYSDPSLGFVGSVSDYFRDQSNGVFNLTFDVAGPVMMPECYAAYGGDTPSQDANIGDMLRYALNAVDGEIDYSKYDWDGDGQVEQVFFIYAGLGQANGGDDNTIWPHKSAVANEDWTDYLVFDGVRVFDYACSCELQPVYTVQDGQTVITDTHIDGVGTICHEFSHCLGLADLYDTDYSGGYGMGPWDLMCSGSYNDNGFRPACYTGFERMQIGWEQPIELTSDTEVTAMKSLAENGRFYIVRNDANADEYYVLENRQPVGRWDAGLPGRGLLAVHVDYNAAAWANNTPNNDPNHQRCTVIPADGVANDYTAATDVYPYGGNNSLTNDSRPAASVYTKNTDGTFYMNKPITGITQNEDGTVNFAFTVMDTTPLFYESFDGCTGRGGNDGSFIGIGSSLGKGSLNTDNDGWTGEGGGASQCAMFTGQATTPTFNIAGQAELTFMAAPLTSGVTEPVINIAVNGNATLSGTQASMTLGRFTSYSAEIEGNGPVSITFSSNATFFLDEVRVSGNTATGITNLVVPGINAKAADNRIYTIDGRYVGTDVNKLSKGLYIRNGEKFIKR